MIDVAFLGNGFGLNSLDFKKKCFNRWGYLLIGTIILLVRVLVEGGNVL